MMMPGHIVLSDGIDRFLLLLLSRPLVTLATIFVIVITPGAGQDGKTSPAGKHEDGVLFDGVSFEGWKKTDFSNSGEVKVQRGTIVMSAGRSMSGITSTRPDLPTTNYELSYEAMRIGGHDFFAAATFPVGNSFITLVNGGWGGSVTGLSSLDGMDASENETTRSVRYQDKTWYKFRVRVTVKMIRCSIDGKEIVAVNHRDRRVGTRIESRRSQPLGFATWETTGAVRNVKIRPLAAAEVDEVDKFEE
jgi:hypothetical protein